MAALRERATRALFGNPYLLLALSALFWAGNAITSRLAVGEVSPMALTTLRWALVGVIVLAVGLKPVRDEWPVLRPRLVYLAIMAFLGFTGFNALYYISAYFTSAVNIGILQGAIPMLVFAIALVVRGTRVKPAQVVGMIAGLIGVGVVAARGDMDVLLGLGFNFGDVLMLVACAMYATYTVALTSRPQVSGFAFFTILAAFALLTSLPPLAAEIAMGKFQWPTPAGWLAIAYTAVFPSVLSQIFFIRGVELIGPGRAGIFVNLVPVFAAVLAVAILGEPFHVYHAVALVLVLGGILYAERARR
ncbi:DMT family transporter [Methylobrevis albus]|uniref:DMT family transporter n=1 Tax=Methylobrevis albus TaxID=2793297 RepID=A0A931I4G2_9HYPH|nr:DMT family transporter [Methylobrevis albus]MBH0239339.1 DMT family transporter [Methylobrevis albus]